MSKNGRRSRSLSAVVEQAAIRQAESLGSAAGGIRSVDRRRGAGLPDLRTRNDRGIPPLLLLLLLPGYCDSQVAICGYSNVGVQGKKQYIGLYSLEVLSERS